MSKEQQKILALLTEHIGCWVDCRELSAIATQYCRVIKELRDEHGHVILNRVQREGRRTVRGYYMLATPRQIAAGKIGAGTPLTQADRDAAAADHSEPTLFDLAPFDSHRDLG